MAMPYTFPGVFMLRSFPIMGTLHLERTPFSTVRCEADGTGWRVTLHLPYIPRNLCLYPTMEECWYRRDDVPSPGLAMCHAMRSNKARRLKRVAELGRITYALSSFVGQGLVTKEEEQEIRKKVTLSHYEGRSVDETIEMLVYEMMELVVIDKATNTFVRGHST